MNHRASSHRHVLGRLLLAMGAVAGVSTCGEESQERCDGDLPAVTYCLDTEQMRSMARHGTGQVPLDPPPTEAEIDAAFLSNGCLRHDWVASSCCNPALGPGRPTASDECCYQICDFAVCCGRALVLGEQPLTADVECREDWLASAAPPSAPPLPTRQALTAAERARLVELWQADALMEHASIASFARFSLQLLALGAPAQLVRDAQAAGLDEVEHARQAFSVASHLAGRALGPSKLARLDEPLHTDLAAVARAALSEGCIGETLAAIIAREQAHQAGDPMARQALLRVAEDETRHAELAFRCVAWALAQGGPELREVLRLEAERKLARLPEPSSTSDVSTAALHYHGRLTADEQRELYQQARARILRPAFATLFAGMPPHRSPAPLQV